MSSGFTREKCPKCGKRNLLTTVIVNKVERKMCFTCLQKTGKEETRKRVEELAKGRDSL
jgi:Zn ribbon nucleic-acid-binding protein